MWGALLLIIGYVVIFCMFIYLMIDIYKRYKKIQKIKKDHPEVKWFE